MKFLKHLQPYIKVQILAFVFAVIAAPLLWWISQQATDELVESRNRVEHTYNVLSQLERLRSEMETVETARRGYAITQDDQYLRPYYKAQKSTVSNLAALEGLTADNPEQQERLAALRPILNELLALAKKDISSQNSDFTQAAETMARAKSLIDQSRALIEQLSAQEEILLGERARESAAKLRELKMWLITISLAFTGLLAFAFVNGQREIRQRREAEDSLLLSQARNEVTVHNLSFMGEMTSLLQACSDTDESLDVICSPS